MPLPPKFEDLKLPAHTAELQQINTEISGRIAVLPLLMENVRNHIVGDLTKMLPQLHRQKHQLSDGLRTHLLNKFNALQELYPQEKPPKPASGKFSRRKAVVISTYEHLQLSRQIQENLRFLSSDEHQFTPMYTPVDTQT